MAKKSLKPCVSRMNKNENILWLEIDHFGKWCIALVYLVPNERFGECNEHTLDELQRDILDLEGKGRILVLGDFNSRVGELPNTFFNAEGDEDLQVIIKRTSDEINVNGMGSKVMDI